MFRLNREKSTPIKKLISFQNATLLDGLIKAEADEKYTSESVVVEMALLEHYLNGNEQIDTAIAANLFNENGIVDAFCAIMNIYANRPELADDSLLPVLEYMRRLAQRRFGQIELTAKSRAKLVTSAGTLLNIIENKYKTNPLYSFPNSDGKSTRHYEEYDMLPLRDLADEKNIKDSFESINLIQLGINAVITFWNFDGGPSNTPSLKNYAGTYIFLCSLLAVARWDDYMADKFSFAEAVKSINFNNESKGTYDATKPALNKIIHLNGKCIHTTSDAIVLHSKANQQDGYFDHAYRVIHGPGMPMTKRPYIFLCKNENEKDLEQILESVLGGYPDEFPDTHDSYMVPILYCGMFLDNRVVWETV